MGRHASVDGARSHPLVAAALERRTAPAAGGTHRGESPVAERRSVPSNAVGWPGEPGRGRGLGWPGQPAAEPDPDRASDDGSVLAALEATDPASPAEQPTPRRSGWRRFFGGRHSSTTSAA